MKGTYTTRASGITLLVAGLVLAACNGQEAESATPDAPASVAVGTENIAIVSQG